MMRLFSILGLCLLFSACGREEPQTPAVPETPEEPALVLQKSDFDALEGFDADRSAEFIRAWQKSCRIISQSSREFIDNSQIKIPAADYRRLCKKAQTLSAQELPQFLRRHFTPWLVTYKGDASGKFTSYFETVIHASRQRSDKYKYPVYGRPDDMIEFNPHDFDETLPSKRLVGRVEGKKVVPYYERAEIMRNGIAAPVVLWADSYVDVYVMQIQGPAVAYLDDGSKVRVAYADNNGLPFKGIGSILLEKKLVGAGQASMDKVKVWLKENMPEAQKYMDENRRFIFHRLSDADGPIGAQGVSLTAGRSLAVDRSYIPLGSLLWLETTGPDREKIRKLMVAQDIGGAIKGAVRGDYYWGSGDEEVLAKAGKMNASGRYFILLPKTGEVTQ